MVQTFMEICIFGSSEREMPGVEISFKGLSMQVVNFVPIHVLPFLQNTRSSNILVCHLIIIGLINQITLINFIEDWAQIYA